MIVVLTGAPGAGKGTQADLIEEKLGLRKVSTGDALRKHVRMGTEIGKVAGALMADGKLVPDDVLFEILKAEFGQRDGEKILLDGYPRNVEQAKTLQTLGERHPVKAVIHLDVSKNQLIERLTGRRVCSNCGKSFHVSFDPPRKEGVCDACGGDLTQRPDDRSDKVAVRLDVYESQTAPVLDYYKEMGLYQKIDGSGEQVEVFKKIEELIKRVAM